MVLTRAKAHPLAAHRNRDSIIPSPWSEGIWSVFINDEAQLHAAIQYVQRHPMKEGLAPQSYDFVIPHVG